jgi:hypothetical protein
MSEMGRLLPRQAQTGATGLAPIAATGTHGWDGAKGQSRPAVISLPRTK